MIECDGIDKKNNEKCKSLAKYIINIDDKINYRCGRHCRNINNKKLIENTDNILKVKRKSEQNIKTLKNNNNDISNESNIEEKKENNNIKEINHKVENVFNEKHKKIETLFTKIDKLCELLNNTTF